MISKKMHFAIYTNVKADTSQKVLLKRYKNYLPNQSDVIVVIGGDGFMLKTLKKYQKYNKPFYGMNMGTYGFLMNKFKIKNMQLIKKAYNRDKSDSMPEEEEFETFALAA